MSKRRFCIPLLLLACLGATRVGESQEPTGTLVVANMDESTVWVIDLPTGRRQGVIQTRAAPHEVAISRDGRTAAVTNYGEGGPGNLIQLIDIGRAEVSAEITVEGYERLHGVAFLLGDSLLALTSERTGEVLVVGAADGRIRKVLETGGRASHMLSQGGDWIYVANILDGTVSRIDPEGDAETLTWPAGQRTEGVAATPDGLEGWTGSMEGGEVVGVEGATGTIVARVEGLQVPYRLAVTPDGATVVISDPPAGELVLVDRAAGEIRTRVDVGETASARGLGADPSPQGFVLSPDGRWAFVSAKAIDRAVVVDLVRGEVTGFVETGQGPDGIAFTSHGAGR